MVRRRLRPAQNLWLPRYITPRDPPAERVV